MKPIVPFMVFMAIGCILITGCVTQKSDNSSISPVSTFTKFTIVGTEGQMTVSLDGSFTPDDAFTGEYPVYIDNSIRGVVATKKPVTIRDTVGNHTIKVCCNTICESENVTVKFGKQVNVDFSRRLKEDLGSSKPAARIIGYYPSAHHITINVELINPTTQPRTISADVRCGYTYIDARSYNRMGGFVQSRLDEPLDACDRETKILNFDLASGSSYLYDTPTITIQS